MADLIGKLIKERALWLAFVLLFVVMSSGGGYLVSGLQDAKRSVIMLESKQEADKIQWQKIGKQNEEHWQDKSNQSFINGYNKAKIECLESRMRQRGDS